MSWLYSLVIAGLLFASNNDTVVKSSEIRAGEAPSIWVAGSDETEKFEQTYPITANGRVGVSNVNGSIVVEAWDRSEVRLEATKIADSKESLAAVQIQVDSQPDAFRVEADYSSWKNDRDKGWKTHRKIEVQFRLWVPKTAVLDEVETVNGSVTVSNFVNRTKISAVNGSVSATNLRGVADLSTVNGEVTADFDRLESGSKISLSTVNGRVNLVIPSDANATIKADSLNGSITNDFGLPVRKGKYIGRDLYGRVGSGDVQIKLDSVNGGLSIGRKNDGKTLNPGTNLLLQKNKEDENWDEDSLATSTEKMNREITRAVRDSEKHAAVGLREAQKELNKIKPEISKATRDSLKSAAQAIEQTAVIMNAEEFKQKLQEANAVQKAALSRIEFANFSFGSPFIEKKTNSFAVKGTPKVAIDAKGCSVKVRGWDKPEVKYVVTSLGSRGSSEVDVEEVTSDSGVSLKVINKAGKFKDEAFSKENAVISEKANGVERVVISEQTAVVTLKDGKTEKYDLKKTDEKTAYESKYGKIWRSPARSKAASPSASPWPIPSQMSPQNFRWNFDNFGDVDRIRIEVFVPKKSNLKIVTDGEVRLEGVSGDIEIDGEDEAINIRDVNGNLHLSAAEAQVRVIGFRGAFDSQTECGDVYLEGDFEKLSAKAAEGTIFLTMPQNSNASFVSNTNIETEGFDPAGSPKWRLGKGGAAFNFSFTEGKLVVRNASTLNNY